jgi:hypothetical protein
MLPINLLKNKNLVEAIQKLVCEAQIKIEEAVNSNNADHTPQLLYQTARQTSRTLVPKTTKLIQNKQRQLEHTLNDMNLDLMQKQVISMKLKEDIYNLEKTIYANKRMHVAARNRLEGEMISKYWTQTNKAKAPRDTLLMLTVNIQILTHLM